MSKQEGADYRLEDENIFRLVVDLEMCNVPRDYRRKLYKYSNETIQIGAVLLDKDFKRIGTLTQYVQPEYGVIDCHIEKLTGIKNSHVKHAPKLYEALLHMIDWIGNRKCKIYAWSESDRIQILHEINAKKIDDIRIFSLADEENWIDYQAEFMNRFKLDRQISLVEALERAAIKPQGRFHDGLDDAVNTGCLIEKMEKNPDFELLSYEMPKLDSKPLSCTLGEIFAGMNLQLSS